MSKFYLKKNYLEDGIKVFTVTDEHLGCLLVNCKDCGTRGVFPKKISGYIPIEPEIRDVGVLSDLHLAFTTTIVSKKFREAVEAARLTGIEFHEPVGYQIGAKKKGAEELRRRCIEEMQYTAIHATGQGGSIMKSCKGVDLKKECSVCGWKEWTLPEETVIVDESEWDGSDFFYVDEYPPLLLSERAVDVLNDAGLSNWDAIRADEYYPRKL